MLRMYVMDQPSKWEEYLHFVKFAYNNIYQASAKMSPFEIMYGRKCSTPISWSNPVDRLMIGPKMLKDMEITMKQVQCNLKISQDRKKSNADINRTPREFVTGDHVFFKVKPRKSHLNQEVVPSWHLGIVDHLKCWKGLDQWRTNLPCHLT